MEYLSKKFVDDEQKLHYLLDETKMNEYMKSKESFPIKGCMKDALHMLCFNPNGSVLTKANICSCEDCIVGDFLKCSDERGKAISLDESSDEDKMKILIVI